MTVYWAEYAWLPDGLATGVAIDVRGTAIHSVVPGAEPAGELLRGLTVPGFANAHSHAFHRALRGRTQHDQGTFWTWRERMYAVAARLDPDSYYRLARAVYAEMVLAGYTSVGEFHYLHHAPGGVPYADPTAMSAALAAAAADAGIRLTLLDTCYLAGGFGVELGEHQLRFSDGTVDAWATRAAAFTPTSELVRTGVAAHSVRAVPSAALPVIAAAAAGRPLHVHLSEQPAENSDCVAAHGLTPTALLAKTGVLGPQTVAVHATHLTALDIGLLADSASRACFCPTTERDLGDGIGPARALSDAGVGLCLGTDSHAVIDAFEEWRALELDERLASRARGRFTPAELYRAATDHASIGWPEAGRIAVGAAADLVTVDLDSIRTAGTAPAAALFAAAASDVRAVLIAGRPVVTEHRHLRVDHPATVLREEIEALCRP
ncbi:formimidoylglutamate deiminase [Nocardia brasiliensis]|uniref:formimidoylglutamate deiminase n=1 Tax=Nocardia brasiliensis TaxID=37326 RepID=UPI00189435AB|nr:formimidoylglutamate deiminase [Nocardia brasiliensis]MBF6130856.1 formimidoylglutamate deiminase [Nocardia brasiliensis]MBF6548239.1 formimidoylglutamate deiminase [Nocardia brasiliensis]